MFRLGGVSVAAVLIIGAMMIAKTGVGGVAGFRQNPTCSMSTACSGRRISLAM